MLKLSKNLEFFVIWELSSGLSCISSSLFLFKKRVYFIKVSINCNLSPILIGEEHTLNWLWKLVWEEKEPSLPYH